MIFISCYISNKSLNISSEQIPPRWPWRRSCWTGWVMAMRVLSPKVKLGSLLQKTQIMRSWRQKFWSATRARWAAMWKRWGTVSVKLVWKNESVIVWKSRRVKVWQSESTRVLSWSTTKMGKVLVTNCEYLLQLEVSQSTSSFLMLRQREVHPPQFVTIVVWGKTNKCIPPTSCLDFVEEFLLLLRC